MRISTNSFFDLNSKRLSDVQSQMDKIAQQVSSGRKILTPADDPVGAGQALEVQQSQSINAQYAKNRSALQNTLGIVDGTLSSITDTLQSIHEQVISAGNGSYSATELAGIATALQGQRDQLLSLANTSDGAGHYLFAGNQTNTRPFVEVSASVSYQGVDSQSQVQVDTSRTMAMSVSGQALFGSSADIFAQLNTTIATLNDPNADPNQQQAVLKALGDSYSQTLQNVTTAQADVGIRLQQLDALDTLGSSRDLTYSQALSRLQDVNYNQALSDLSRQQLALQAAQKTFMQISNLSLFNYMN